MCFYLDMWKKGVGDFHPTHASSPASLNISRALPIRNFCPPCGHVRWIKKDDIHRTLEAIKERCGKACIYGLERNLGEVSVRVDVVREGNTLFCTPVDVVQRHAWRLISVHR
jgi:hypothetical protein